MLRVTKLLCRFISLKRFYWLLNSFLSANFSLDIQFSFYYNRAYVLQNRYQRSHQIAAYYFPKLYTSIQ